MGDRRYAGKPSQYVKPLLQLQQNLNLKQYFTLQLATKVYYICNKT